ncbi:SRPBCC family protein [Tumebacillus flagellatus]|uniref:Activator of Hsp90 ATPase homologue 1/2-like C-terminal domain-containing protein n=1 Tax=Tumebacillus flagellatus TaxID=1157490 RepID=A0A074LQN1_9BACL|nr:SRPBCC family protein [Tumebacillus flagellatus]KEO82805.1 hypothetical protein EL26_13745 [Tumebacillus flagellatus]
MNNLTKFIIRKPAHEVFEAFVDPSKIANFWFSSSSARWEAGKTITLRYEEYNAQVDIKILEVDTHKKIIFQWGAAEAGNVVTITLTEQENESTIIEVKEEGFTGSGDELLNTMLDNKEGWVYMLSCLKAYLEFGVTNLRAALLK